MLSHRLSSRTGSRPAAPARSARSVVVMARSSKGKPFADGYIHRPSDKAAFKEEPAAPDSPLGLLNAIGQGFVSIFSPAKDSVPSWEGTSTAYTGKVSRSRGKPFSDGYKSSGKVPAEAPVDPDSTVWGYLSGALGRVMGNEGPKDQSRPDFKKTYRKGYTGNVNTQSRGDRSRGFHSRIF